jgi:hypothetical protein
VDSAAPEPVVMPLDPATVAARANKNDPNLNFLTRQHLDQLFATRVVKAGEKPWALRRAARSLPADFSFDAGGVSTHSLNS